MPILSFAISTPSTAAIVTLSNPRFENGLSVEDANSIRMDMAIKFNGITGELGDTVTFARNATQTVKNTAIRTKVNSLIGAYESGVSLNNANIQIVGLPV